MHPLLELYNYTPNYTNRTRTIFRKLHKHTNTHTHTHTNAHYLITLFINHRYLNISGSWQILIITPLNIYAYVLIVLLAWLFFNNLNSHVFIVSMDYGWRRSLTQTNNARAFINTNTLFHVGSFFFTSTRFLTNPGSSLSTGCDNKVFKWLLVFLNAFINFKNVWTCLKIPITMQKPYSKRGNNH